MNWSEILNSIDWSTIIGSIVGGLIGGLFTFLGVKKTLKHQDNEKKKDILKEEFNNRPRLELVRLLDVEHANLKSNSDCSFLLTNIKQIQKHNDDIAFLYDDKIANQSNFCCVEYEFKNTGKTEIDGICFVSNQQRTTVLVPLNEIELLLEHKTLIYEAWSNKRFIKPGESTTVKVCYLKNKILHSPISSMATIYMQDINGHIWRQPLFCPTEAMENSFRATYKEFSDDRNVMTAIECFKGHLFW